MLKRRAWRQHYAETGHHRQVLRGLAAAVTATLQNRQKNYGKNLKVLGKYQVGDEEKEPGVEKGVEKKRGHALATVICRRRAAGRTREKTPSPSPVYRCDRTR